MCWFVFCLICSLCSCYQIFIRWWVLKTFLYYMNGSRNLYLSIWHCFKWLEKSLFNMTLFQMVRELFILKAENVSNGLRILYLKSDIVLNGLRSDFVFKWLENSVLNNLTLCLSVWQLLMCFCTEPNDLHSCLSWRWLILCE